MHTTCIVRGGPGVGKTTYGKQLASARSAALLEIDTVLYELNKAEWTKMRVGELPSSLSETLVELDNNETLKTTLSSTIHGAFNVRNGKSGMPSTRQSQIGKWNDIWKRRNNRWYP